MISKIKSTYNVVTFTIGAVSFAYSVYALGDLVKDIAVVSTKTLIKAIR